MSRSDRLTFARLGLAVATRFAVAVLVASLGVAVAAVVAFAGLLLPAGIVLVGTLALFYVSNRWAADALAVYSNARAIGLARVRDPLTAVADVVFAAERPAPVVPLKFLG